MLDQLNKGHLIGQAILYQPVIIMRIYFNI